MKRTTALAWLLAVLVAAVAAVAYLRSSSGRAWAGRLIARQVSAAIPGSLRIGEVERLGFFEPRVRDLEIADPQGRVVIRADRAELDVDALALATGRLVVHWARVDGGLVVIEVARNGRTTIENAFSKPSSGKPSVETDGLVMRWKRIEVRNVRVQLRNEQETVLDLVGVQGLLQLDRPPLRAVQLKLERVRGRATEPKLLGHTLRLTHVQGWIHGDEHQVMELAVHARLGSGRIDGTLKLFKRKAVPVEVRLEPVHGVQAELLAQLAQVRSWSADDVRVSIED